MYAPQIECLQRQLVQRLWFQIVYYYNLTVETVRDIPHHLRLLWDGAFSFNDIYNPEPPLQNLKLAGFALSASHSNEMKIGELTSSTHRIHPSILNSSEELGLSSVAHQSLSSFTAASGASAFPSALDSPTPTTAQPLELSILVFIISAFFTVYKSFSKPHGKGRANGCITPCGKSIDCEDRGDPLKVMAGTIEQMTCDLAASASVHREALEALSASHAEATKDMKQNVSVLTESNRGLAEDAETLREENKKQKNRLFEYTQAFEKRNKKKSPSSGGVAAIPSTQDPSKDAVIAELKAKVNELQTRLVYVKEAVEIKTGDIKTLRCESQATEARHRSDKDEVQRPLKIVHSKNVKAVSENDQLKKQVADLENQIKSKRVLQFEDRCNNPSHKILLTLNQNETRKTEQLVRDKAELASKLAERDTELDHVNEANILLTVGKAELATTNRGLQHDVESLQGRYSSDQEDMEHVKQKHHTLEKEILLLNSDHTALKQENTSLKNETVILKSHEENLEVEKIWLEAEKDSLQEHKAALEVEIAARRQRVNLLEQEKDALKTQVIILEQRKDSLQQDNTALEAENIQLHRRLTDRGSEVEEKDAPASPISATDIEEKDDKNKNDSGPKFILPFSSAPTVDSHDAAVRQQEGIDNILNYNVLANKPHISFHWAPKRQRIPRGVQAQRRTDRFNQGLTYVPPTGPRRGFKVDGRSFAASAVVQPGIPSSPASLISRPPPTEHQQQLQNSSSSIIGDKEFQPGDYGNNQCW